MVTCPVCNIHVPYTYLRVDHPTCPNYHDLGTWVHCKNPNERHVYVSSESKDGKCPFCELVGSSPMKEGVKVKCVHVTDAGIPCPARPFTWIKEGPPCFMNHISKMVLL